ncbi:MAG: leucine-rich repeat protein [Ruminococcus sp.]|nr:leucine-rich repeat protein [Ruminococcus sp.]
MKIHKRVVAGIMVVCLIGSMPVFQENISPVASMAESSEIVKSGTCGENVTWVLDDKGILTISGTGDMEDYGYHYNDDGYMDYSITSWSSEEKSIRKVIIEDGVTSIGSYAFAGELEIIEIEIPESVKTIGTGAFNQCINLTKIEMPESITYIGSMAFSWCLRIENIIIPERVTTICGFAFENTTLKEITVLNPECNIDDYGFAIGEGGAGMNFINTICGYDNSTAQAYAEKHNCQFESLGKAPEKTGDMNGDNEFNISDVVMFQKYLLGGTDTEITDWKQADLNSDGVLDVFDLVLMRKKLIEK